MPLTDDELDTIEAAAYLCDGEPFSYFPEAARLIAAYARASERAESDGSPPPDPRLFLQQWDAEELQLRIEADYEPLPF